ncbi:MAG: hypothetical protein R2712_29825 [Vicinamibacterales bacterium]
MLLEDDGAHAVALGDLRRLDGVERARDRQLRRRADVLVDVDDPIQLLHVVVQLGVARGRKGHQHRDTHQLPDSLRHWKLLTKGVRVGIRNEWADRTVMAVLTSTAGA